MSIPNYIDDQLSKEFTRISIRDEVSNQTADSIAYGHLFTKITDSTPFPKELVGIIADYAHETQEEKLRREKKVEQIDILIGKHEHAEYVQNRWEGSRVAIFRGETLDVDQLRNELAQEKSDFPQEAQAAADRRREKRERERRCSGYFCCSAATVIIALIVVVLILASTGVISRGKTTNDTN